MYYKCWFRSDGSLVPDGENFVVAASKLPAGGKTDDITTSESEHVKPVEEISYGLVMLYGLHKLCLTCRNVGVCVHNMSS